MYKLSIRTSVDFREIVSVEFDDLKEAVSTLNSYLDRPLHWKDAEKLFEYADRYYAESNNLIYTLEVQENDSFNG